MVMAEETLPATPGILDGTGATFALTDSDYLNISVTSSVEIELYLNSAPMIIHMAIAAAAGDTSADISLGGLEASTSYWMYQDGSVEGVEISSDANGSYSFTLDLTEARDIMIQPGKSTVYIYDDGASGTGYQCTLIGTWDATSKTCTLTQDVNDSIYIYDPNNTKVGITLDGNGYQVNLPRWGWVQLSGSNHTVKNLTINGIADLPYGQYYCDTYGGYYCELRPTGHGVYLNKADSATVTNVTVSNSYYGLYVYNASNSNISDNTFSGAAYGAYVYGYYYQYYCDLGYTYYCYGSSGNTLSDNAFSPYSTTYDYYGMYLDYEVDDNIIRGNTFSNFNYGLYLNDSHCYYYGQDYNCPSGNTVYQNNFIDNSPYQIHAGYGYSNTVFNLAAPDGGNYYNNYDEPTEGCGDADSDGFCDNPYAIPNYYNVGLYDYLPWTIQDGWLNEPPVADANGPYLVAVGGQVLLDGSASSDPDDDELTETWTVAGGTVDGNLYTAGSVAGIYDIQLVVNDGQVDSEAVSSTVVVYDPDGGFVTGGGWIDSPEGAYLADLTLTGKANFGFVSKYVQGATEPTGETQFRFKAGDLNFHSDSYEWLVVNQDGTNAQYKGRGTINGELAPNGEFYGFMIWAGDGDISATADTFRIRIWYEDEVDGTEYDVYDNGFDQAIGGGSIQIHTGG